MPPAPELEQKIIAAKEIIAAGRDLTDVGDSGLSAEEFLAIIGRPARTRPNTFVDAKPDVAPVVGTRRAIVLLVDFSDAPATRTQAHYNDLLFSTGTFATGSMRDFYREASYGQLDVVGEVSGTGGPTAGWYRAPQPKSFYTNGKNGFGTYPQNAQKLVEDILALADSHVNFAPFARRSSRSSTRARGSSPDAGSSRSSTSGSCTSAWARHSRCCIRVTTSRRDPIALVREVDQLEQVADHPPSPGGRGSRSSGRRSPGIPTPSCRRTRRRRRRMKPRTRRTRIGMAGDGVPGDLGLAGGRPEERGQRAQRRRLAGPVRPTSPKISPSSTVRSTSATASVLS